MTQEKAIREAKTLREKILAKISSIEHRTIGNEGKFAGRLADSLVTLFQEQYASSSSEKGDGEVNANGLTQYTDLWKALDSIGAEKYGSARNLIKRFIKTHKSYKQFTLDKDFDKWIADNRYEWIRAQRGHFMWYKRFEGSLSGVIGKTTSEIYNEYKSLTPKEHSEGEEFEDEEACAYCGATEGHYAYCPDYTNDPNP